MCGIVGYVGSGMSKTHVLDGLARLEYRGYDAGGFACIDIADQRLRLIKSLGTVDRLACAVNQSAFDGYTGIGHTRWATHGAAGEVTNAHPHTDCTEKISIVHNGIIENYRQLKESLSGTGHIFKSGTDTEIAAHLLEELLSSSPETAYREAFFAFVQKLEGAFALVCLVQDLSDMLIAIRKRSPLCVGIGSSETFIASDPLAFAGKTRTVLYMPDESIAFVGKNSVELFDFHGNKIPQKTDVYDVPSSNLEKGPHEHFMLKEIYEQKRVIGDTLFSLKNRIPLASGYTPARSAQAGLKSGLKNIDLKAIEAVHLIGCGTSRHAGLIGQFFFERIAGIKTHVHLASEFRYNTFFPEKNSLFIAVSQSGETADTLEAMRMVKTYKLPTVALTNVESSSMMREADGFVITKAGPEIAVASTKAFTAQLTALFWLAHVIAYEKKLISAIQLESAENDLLIAAEILENTLELYKDRITKIDAPHYAQFKHFIFLGRNISYPLALEAALKLKEISYLFTDACPAGELKHGSLALIDANTPVFLFSCRDAVIYQKIISNAQEIKSRHGHLVVFAFEDQHELITLADTAYIFPNVNPLLGPLAMAGLVQFFCYHIATILNRPIDKPRNLAKSVTVE